MLKHQNNDNAVDDQRFCEIEIDAGPAQVPPACPEDVDRYRRGVYVSYESFLRNQLACLDRDRSDRWQRDYSCHDAYIRSLAPMRAKLREMLGFWVAPEARPAARTWDTTVLLETDAFVATRSRFEIMPGLESYAVELTPTNPGPHPGLLAQHGYSGTPELVCGFAATANEPDYSYRSLGLRAVRRGYHVLAVCHPSGYGRETDALAGLPEFPDHGTVYGKNRLHRLAVMAGGTLFGLDMMGSSRGVDLLTSRDGVDPGRVGVYGLSQGGQSALFLPALDQRIKASVCSAYFNTRFLKLIGPVRATSYLDSLEEDKFFSAVISCFSDADIVSLIAPRAFAVEAGLLDRAVDFEKSKAEFELAQYHYDKLGIGDRIEFIPHAEGHVSVTRRAFEFLDEHLRASGS